MNTLRGWKEEGEMSTCIHAWSAMMMTLRINYKHQQYLDFTMLKISLTLVQIRPLNLHAKS